MAAMDVGGFKCEFVEDDPSREYECPICFLILCDPYQFSCCGCTVCRVCLHTCRRHNAQVKCPKCNRPGADKDSFPDTRLKLRLYDRNVHCSNKNDGCEWMGRLGGLDKHLNKPPYLAGRLEGCPLSDIQCAYCLLPLQRRHSKMHEEECDQRPFNCRYCNKQGMHRDILKHELVCPKRAEECTCGIPVLLGEMPTHKLQHCPEEVVSCPFNTAGCVKRLPRKDLLSHLRTALDSHFDLLETYISTNPPGEQVCTPLMAALMKSLRENKGGIKFTKSTPNKKEEFVLKCALGVCAIVVLCIALLGLDGLALLMVGVLVGIVVGSGTGCYLRQLLNVFNASEAIQLSIPYSDQWKQSGDEWTSPPFYSHPGGYKMCLSVYPGGNGEGKGSHVSVYARLMQGPFDDLLEWPFQGEIQLTLKDQRNNKNITDKIVFKNVNDASCISRVVGNEKGTRYGKQCFIARTELEAVSHDGNLIYISNNHIYICVRVSCNKK